MMWKIVNMRFRFRQRQNRNFLSHKDKKNFFMKKSREIARIKENILNLRLKFIVYRN